MPSDVLPSRRLAKSTTRDLKVRILSGLSISLMFFIADPVYSPEGSRNMVLVDPEAFSFLPCSAGSWGNVFCEKHQRHSNSSFVNIKLDRYEPLFVVHDLPVQ